MSDMFEDQQEYLVGAVLAEIARNPGICTSDLLLKFCQEVVYPVRVKGSPSLAPEPFVPDPSDVINALQHLLTTQDLIMQGKSVSLDKQQYRVR